MLHVWDFVSIVITAEFGHVHEWQQLVSFCSPRDSAPLQRSIERRGITLPCLPLRRGIQEQQQ